MQPSSRSANEVSDGAIRSGCGHYLCGTDGLGPGVRAAARAHFLGYPASEIGGGPGLNSPPLTLSAVQGRVVPVDRQGVVRYYHIGEGAYQECEAMIQRLLADEQ